MTNPTTTTAAATPGAPIASTNVFSKIFHWVGLVALGALHIVNKADADVDVVEPEIVSLLAKGESIASIIPGINTEVVPFLNAGVALVGAVKASLDGTVALEPEVAAQLASLKQEGYSFIPIETDLKEDVEQLITANEAAFKTAAGAVSTLQAAQTVPSTKITAEVAANVAKPAEAPASATGVAQRPIS